jgi:hypothetical protein
MMLTSFVASALAAPTISEFPLSVEDRLPSAITVAPDGNLWFSEAAGVSVGSSTTGGAMSEFTGLSGPAMRVYKDAWEMDEVLAEIRRCAGTHFDPELVSVFLGMAPHLGEDMHASILAEKASRTAPLAPA